MLRGIPILMSRRDGAIVAWHEVPGTVPPRQSRPVGYGMIRAGLRSVEIGSKLPRTILAG
jgi:hypothetical protein